MVNWTRQFGILIMAAIFAIYWTGKQVPCVATRGARGQSRAMTSRAMTSRALASARCVHTVLRDMQRVRVQTSKVGNFLSVCVCALVRARARAHA